MQIHGRSRWLALIVVCIGDLMIVLDATIVNVALPSIKDDLGFSDESLAWVVNAYLLTFGGFMLLGGRLGDIYGARRMFLAGLTLFTLASLACGVANSDGTLVAARAVQGIGGAIVAAIALALLMKLFTEPAERAKAMGVFGFVVSAGGTLGVLLGGVLTDALDWHWIFLVNLPIGIAVFAGCLVLLPKDLPVEERGRLDVAGAVTVTIALMLAVYAIVNGNEEGWGSAQTLGLLAAAVVLLGVFLVVETRAALPLVPLGIFRHRTLATANGVAALLAAAMFSWFFLSALYLQLVLGYSPLEVGLAFLPATLLMGAFSLGLSARIVMRFGIRTPLVAGLGFLAAGLLWFARAPVDGNYVVDVLPSMILLALGAGLAFNPLLLAAMGDVSPAQSGLASGLVNTTQMMGGALGLAILASLAAARTDSLLDSGTGDLGALNGGYHWAFVVGAIFAVVGMILTAALIHAKMPAMGGEHGAEAAPETAPETAPEATPVGERGSAPSDGRGGVVREHRRGVDRVRAAGLGNAARSRRRARERHRAGCPARRSHWRAARADRSRPAGAAPRSPRTAPGSASRARGCTRSAARPGAPLRAGSRTSPSCARPGRSRRSSGSCRSRSCGAARSGRACTPS